MERLFKNKQEIIAGLNETFGIDINEVLKNSGIEEHEKFNMVYRLILTAALKKAKRGNPAESFCLPPDFDIENYVNNQFATNTVSVSSSQNVVIKVPGLLLTADETERMKKLNGKELTKKVEELYNAGINMLVHLDDVNKIANILLAIGGLAIGVVGAAVALAGFAAVIGGIIAAPPTGGTSLGWTAAGLVCAAIALKAAGPAVIASFASLLSALTIFDRDFTGIVLNDTPYDANIPGWSLNKKTYKDDKKRTEGIYLDHGLIAGFMMDEPEQNSGQKEKPYIPGRPDTAPEHGIGCFCGFFQFQREEGVRVVGSEGIIRFEMKGVSYQNTDSSKGAAGPLKIDVLSACPITQKTRMNISTKLAHEYNKKSKKYELKELKDSGKDLYHAWDDQGKVAHIEKVEEDFRLGVTVDSVTHDGNSPGYGIAYFEKK